MTRSSRTYLANKRAKLPYARGCVLVWRNTPSGASDPASEQKPIQPRPTALRTFSSDMVKNTDWMRLSSSTIRSMMVSSTEVPRSCATSASDLPVNGRSASLRNPTSRIFSALRNSFSP